jgi:hypothetical protein
MDILSDGSFYEFQILDPMGEPRIERTGAPDGLGRLQAVAVIGNAMEMDFVLSSGDISSVFVVRRINPDIALLTGVGPGGSVSVSYVRDPSVDVDAVATPKAPLGAACEVDGDCVDEHCFVPGTGENPICTRACTGPEECPAFSLCAPVDGGNFCFYDCSIQTCATGLGAPDTTNPVVCVPDFPLDTEDPMSDTISICIQESEP